MESITWYECSFGGGVTNHATEEEARARVAAAMEGYPELKNMADEYRSYWKKAATQMKIAKVTQTRELLK